MAPPLNVVYDGHIFRWQSVGGIRRYFTELIERLPSTWSIAMIGARPTSSLPSHKGLCTSPSFDLRPGRFTRPLQKIWWRHRYAARADIFHPTYYGLTGGLTYSDIPCPKIVTVHDLIAARYPQLEDDSPETIRIQELAFAHADHFICVSRYTEQDLLDYCPALNGRTTVIYHGSSFPVTRGIPPIDLFDRPSFLFVGRRRTYKNFFFLLRAFALARELNPKIRLHVAGPPLDMEERWEIHFLNLSDAVCQTVYPSEKQLQSLYRSSVALVYPSRHEGFGIPPLEAMACGTLAITSNVTSLPEVVGDAGIMLDPTDISSWVSCMIEVANGGANRAERIEKGWERAEQFSWDRTADEHVKLYRRLHSAT